MSPDSISSYVSSLDPQRAAVCDRLAKSIDATLPRATSKLWHSIPVWFVGENPAVGFTARKTGVMLMFWNGQHFEEPELENTGSFHMAQIAYEDPAQIDEQKLSRWLEKAGTSIWDMVGERRAFVAKRRKAKAVKRAKARKPAKKTSKPKLAKRTKSKKRAKAKK
jgi:hypothetical protein